MCRMLSVRPVAVSVVVAVSLGWSAELPAGEAVGGGKKVRVLLTVDGSHGWAEKEPIFMALVKQAGDFELTRSGDMDEWLPDRIRKYDLVVVHTTRGNLSDAQADGLKGFIEAGGGLVGIHSATDSFRKSDKYWALIGGRFTGHKYGRFTVEVVDQWHPIMIGIKDFEIEDEDYQHQYHPSADVHILARKKGDDRAMGWTRKIGKGRLVYLANGHGEPAFKTPEFQKMLVNSMYWAARRPVPGSGYVALFDGTDLKGWNLAPVQKSWQIEDGLLVNKPGRGGSLATSDVYDNFVVRLDWKLEPGGNSGVYIRETTEIQILDDFADRYRHIKPCQHAGSVYCQIASKPGALKKAGQWNEMQVLAQGRKVQVWLNGQQVIDGSFDDTPELKKRPTSGHIILQYHGGGLWFRDIEVKPLE
jgi:type 1 glutamine amidotransferase